MLLTVLSVPDCPNTNLLLERVHTALDGRAADLRQVVVDSAEQASNWGMAGSPTLLVDGVDPFGRANEVGSVSCRLYRNADGTISGAPPVEELRAVTARSSERDDPGKPADAVDVVGRGGRGRLAPRAGGLRAVQQTLLRAFALTGHLPDGPVLEEVAATHGRSAAGVLHDLAAADFLTLDERAEPRAVYPFSVAPSRHRVCLDDGPQIWAMCAIDALGIPPMVSSDGTIETTDPVTAAPISVRVTGSGEAVGPPGMVVLVGRNTAEGSAEDICCASINMFESGHSAARWAAMHPGIRGVALELDAAAQLGRMIFGGLLRED